ncbi:MAG: polynucleotide adenylyltransferase PcnB [Planctomycetes bacterium]|nr:polynucleotide adenylyltransferase PcnB [Planctomycetota bacterium]
MSDDPTSAWPAGEADADAPTAPPRPSGAPRIVEAQELVDAISGEPALRVISRLQRHGHEAYLVGGCVRDLLVGLTPKDFDVATSAHPRQVRRLFPRNSHIIGRRFRLVHIRYGHETIIETATFRSEPEGVREDDLLITEDNTYGTAEEDARRRDFTVNGLFLDPSSERILDWVGGLEDVEGGLLRTIGDPAVRIPEDPVRILRAIKFATRLGFRIEDATWQAMCDNSRELERSAPPRVLEEILRLVRSGTALGAFRKLRQCGALAVLLPELDEHLGPLEGASDADHKRADGFWRLLEALDTHVHDGYEPSTAVALALLHHDMAEREADPETRRGPGGPPEWQVVCGEVLEPLSGNARLSRRDTGRARRIIYQQRNFTRVAGRRFRPNLFCLAEEFPESLELFRLRCEARGEGWDLYKAWVERSESASDLGGDELEAEKRRARRGRRRPRRRKRSS